MKNLLIGAALHICLIAPAMAQDAVVVPQAATEQPATPPLETGANTPPQAPVSPAAPVAPAEPNNELIAALPSPDSQLQAGDAASGSMEAELNARMNYLNPNINVNAMPSLFLSVWEHDLIMDARRGLTTRVPDGMDDGVTPMTGPREVVLGGIVYTGRKDWTIWINNIRVSPDSIPEEVIDLKVFKEYIELEWFDNATNQIYPIRLRSHQRFNLDTRMFLPG